MRRFFGVMLLVAAVSIAVMVMFSSSPGAKATLSSVQASVVVPQPDPVRVKGCRDLMKYVPRGAIKSWTVDGEYGTVVVGTPYYVADFEAKQSLDLMVRCILSEGRKDDYGIKYVGYLDPYSHKEIAKWSKYTGFSVD